MQILEVTFESKITTEWMTKGGNMIYAEFEMNGNTVESIHLWYIECSSLQNWWSCIMTK